MLGRDVCQHMAQFMPLISLSRFAATCSSFRRYFGIHSRLVEWRKLVESCRVDGIIDYHALLMHMFTSKKYCDNFSLLRCVAQKWTSDKEAQRKCCLRDEEAWDEIFAFINRPEEKFFLDLYWLARVHFYSTIQYTQRAFAVSCCMGHVSLVKEMISQDWAQITDVRQGFLFALDKGQFEIVDLFFEAFRQGRFPDDMINSRIVLMNAIHHGNRRYIDIGFDLPDPHDAHPVQGTTWDFALHHASEQHDLITIERILDKYPQRDFNLALSGAALGGHIDLMERWVGAGATRIADCVSYARSVLVLQWIEGKAHISQEIWRQTFQQIENWINGGHEIPTEVLHFIKSRLIHF